MPRAPHLGLARTDRRLTIVGFILIAVISGITGWLILAQRTADVARGRQATADLAQVLAEQSSRILQPVDLTLREILGRLTAAGTERVNGWGSKATFDLLTERLKGLSQVDAFMIIGPNGRLLNFSRAYPPAQVDASERDYFLYLSTHDDHALVVSAPAKSYLAGKWTVFFTRRINGEHGEFAGIIVAAMTLSFLEDFYRAVTPEKMAVTVLRRDGVILLRHPHTEEQIGSRMPSDRPWYGLLEGQGGSYRSPDFINHAARLVSVRPVREFPLIINVSMAEAEALAGWLKQSLWLIAGAMSAAASLIFLLRMFGIQYDRLAAQNAQLETSRLQFNAVLGNMSQGVTLFDHDQRMVVCNRGFMDMYRLSEEQTRPGTPFADVIRHRIARGTFLAIPPEDYMSRAKYLVDTSKSFELFNELSDGRTIFLHSRPLGGGGWVSTHEDITERRRAEATLAFMARHDALTTLPNRTLFQERLTEAMALAQHGTLCALLCLDLDRFKVINDTLGHPVGDSLLRTVAARLTAAVREVDTVARLGGDEFAIIQVGLNSPVDAELLAERIIATMRQPYEIDGHRVVSGTSIGISIAPRDGTASETLLKNADIALYLAKTERRGIYRLFEPEMDIDLQIRRGLELDLREALPAEAFDLHYQPILDLQSGTVIGFEALIRWNHPIRGLINPAEFIPLAEETGLIIPIGEWVLRKACVDAAAWPRDIEIAVNLSPAQFKSGQLFDAVQRALAISGLDPHRLELEITETVLLQNSENTLALLHQLRALGIRIALDDFGTGYSSLGYLRSFPFDKIKIDRTFIRDVDTNVDSAVIVGGIVGIARGLGMTTVAEGVETAGQLAKVRDQGCALVQGYLFSRPRPIGEVPALIRRLHVRDLHVLDQSYVAGVAS
jgi:diguanylate cyclase (GGDEF)-like protein